MVIIKRYINYCQNQRITNATIENTQTLVTWIFLKMMELIVVASYRFILEHEHSGYFALQR